MHAACHRLLDAPRAQMHMQPPKETRAIAAVWLLKFSPALGTALGAPWALLQYEGQRT